MSANGWTEKTSKALAAQYREMVKRQRAMPLEEQHKMGPALRDAKAKFYVQLEYERMGFAE